MTRAERTRTIKFVLTESSRWLLHRRRDTKEDKHIRMQEKNKKTKKRKEKRKVGSKAQKQEEKSYSRRLHSNKSSRLCYKPETGSFPHHLPYASCSRRQHYQVSLLPLSSPPPPADKSTKTKQNCLDSVAVATQVPPISRTGT